MRIITLNMIHKPQLGEVILFSSRHQLRRKYNRVHMTSRFRSLASSVLVMRRSVASDLPRMMARPSYTVFHKNGERKKLQYTALEKIERFVKRCYTSSLFVQAPDCALPRVDKHLCSAWTSPIPWNWPSCCTSVMIPTAISILQMQEFPSKTNLPRWSDTGVHFSRFTLYHWTMDMNMVDLLRLLWQKLTLLIDNKI